MKEPGTRDHLDLLLHIERLTEELNDKMNARSKFVLRRYPLTFAIFILFGVVAVSEGVKGIIERVEFLNGHPWTMFLLGLIILLLVGSVYRKLDK
jgi:hypothetical protein